MLVKLRTLLAVLAIVPTISNADSNFDERAKNSYHNVQQQAYFYCEIPKGSKKENISFIKTHFDNFKVKTGYKFNHKFIELRYDVESRQVTSYNYRNTIGHSLDGKIVKWNSMAEDFNMLQNIECRLEIGHEPFHSFTNSQVHINVHPHQGYDTGDLITDGVRDQIADISKEQLVLLDYVIGSRREPSLNDFFSQANRNFQLSTFFPHADLTVTEETPILVSPTGNNKYNFQLPKLEVSFTGGNQNYCMWNNTVRLIDGLVSNSANRVLKINYLVDSVVVQKRGILGRSWRGPLHISGRQMKDGNSLINVFKNMKDKDRVSYHSAYFGSMRYHLTVDREHLFSKATVIYKSKSFTKQEVYSGSGHGEYIIELNYINY